MTRDAPLRLRTPQVVRHAPVASIGMDLVHGPVGIAAEGWAAPAGGPLPCLLMLTAGSSVVAQAAATRFSSRAARDGRRLGWCGVRLGGLDLAAALDDDVRVLCAVSGETVHRWTAAEILLGAPRPAPAEHPMQTVTEFLRAMRQASGCDDPATVAPFCHHLMRRRGGLAVVVACYRWILRRVPAAAEAQRFHGDILDGDVVGTCFRGMLGSQEYLADPHPLPGPFDRRFPFELDALDEHGGSDAAPHPPPVPGGPGAGPDAASGTAPPNLAAGRAAG